MIPLRLSGFAFENPWAGLAVLVALVLATALARRPRENYFRKNTYTHPLVGFIEPPGYSRPRRLLFLELLLALLLALSIASPTLSYTVTKTVTKQAASKLTVPPRPVLVVIIDTSGSMAGWKIEAAKKAITRLIEAIARLNQTVDIGLISFSHHVKQAMPPTSNITSVLEAVKKLSAGGGTMYTYPLTTAYSWLSIYRHFNQTAIIVFATDGLPADRLEYREVLKKLARIGVKIYTVFIGSTGTGRAETEYMARVGHGKSYTATNADELVKVFQKIAREASNIIMNVTINAKLRIEVAKKLSLAPVLYTLTAITLAATAIEYYRELGLAT